MVIDGGASAGARAAFVTGAVLGSAITGSNAIAGAASVFVVARAGG